MNNYCASQTASAAYYCTSGFYAAPAWDPTTGWGSVDLPALGNITGFAVSGIAASSPAAAATLSAGAIAGIVIAIVVVLAVIGTYTVNRMCAKPVATNNMATRAAPLQVQGHGHGQAPAPVVSSMNPVYATNVVVVGRPVQPAGVVMMGNR